MMKNIVRFCAPSYLSRKYFLIPLHPPPPPKKKNQKQKTSSSLLHFPVQNYLRALGEPLLGEFTFIIYANFLLKCKTNRNHCNKIK
jgi:hypothetical protein